MNNNIQPNKFQFIININGNDEEIVSQSPENWLQTAIKFTRSKTYGGLFRGETLPTKFVKKAAMLLRKEFYKKSVLAFVKNKIRMLNPNTWTYYDIYNGRLDFTTSKDTRTSFEVNSITDDFTAQLSANESVDYLISLDVPEAINIELTPLTLKETATFVPGAPPDGNIHSDYFVPLQLVTNTQNSVNYSSKSVPYGQLRTPDFTTSNDNFFFSRVTGKLKLTGSLQCKIFIAPVATAHLKLYIINNSGVVRVPLIDVNTSAGSVTTITLNQVISVTTGEKLFLYQEQVDSEDGSGITVASGEIDLAYSTTSPATMCKGLPAWSVFQKLLQAMNSNLDSGPNLPVPWKSNLLTGALGNLIITSADSIRLGTGSLFNSSDTLFPGTYLVIEGSVTYAGTTFVTGNNFPYVPGELYFSGSGIVEKVVSGFVGAIYNPGDSLQPGGVYLVGGAPGSYITYNSVNVGVGEFFNYVLGEDTFTASDPDTNYVEQTAASPQLITNFRDFWQSIFSIQGGNCAFGIEDGVCFIEDLRYVFRSTIGNLDCGVIDDTASFTPATDLIPTSIRCGYRDPQLSTLNGFLDVMSEQVYTMPIIALKKELNLVSVYGASPYAIEEIRISQSDTAASRSDNSVFFVYKKQEPENTEPIGVIGFYYHPLRTEGIMTNPTTGQPMITGVDQSYYNWYISPKQNLLRGGAYLGSVFYNMKGYKITLSSALKNTAMVTTDTTGRRVSEAEPVSISTLPDPLFLPYYASFKPGLPKNALQMLDSVPYGFIRFTYMGRVYKMFADTISVDVGQNTQQEFKGLLTPGNDLRSFIH